MIVEPWAAERMRDAFARLKRQEECPKHCFAIPRPEKKRGADYYSTKCTECGARYGRPTLEQLRAEVPDVP